MHARETRVSRFSSLRRESEFTCARNRYLDETIFSSNSNENGLNAHSILFSIFAFLKFWKIARSFPKYIYSQYEKNWGVFLFRIWKEFRGMQVGGNDRGAFQRRKWQLSRTPKESAVTRASLIDRSTSFDAEKPFSPSTFEINLRFWSCCIIVESIISSYEYLLEITNR